MEATRLDDRRDPKSTAEAALAASYNGLLRSRPQLAAQSEWALAAAHDEQGLMFSGRRLCTVLRPRFITRERLAQLEHISSTLAAVFERAGDVILASDRLLDRAGATDQERALWEIDPGYTGYTVTSRLDSFMPGSEPHFVEYNAESPASIGFCDVLSDVFRALPAMRAWQGARELETFNARRHLLDTLLEAYREWGGNDTPTVAVIDWEAVVTRRDFELCAEFFREHGIETVICDPRALRYSGGVLRHGDTPITLVYRRVLLHELLEHADEARDLLDAYRDGAICMVNSPRSKLLHKKAVLALLSEGLPALALSGEEREIIEATIPWTRLLEDRRTTCGGQEVELVPFALGNQDRLALKPSDDYGGRGVVLGWDVDAEAWARAVESAVGQQYVLQERVPAATAEFPVWEAEDVQLRTLLVDTDPLLFNGRLGGLLTRISGSALLNVTAGAGSTVPSFVVASEET